MSSRSRIPYGMFWNPNCKFQWAKWVKKSAEWVSGHPIWDSAPTRRTPFNLCLTQLISKFWYRPHRSQRESRERQIWRQVECHSECSRIFFSFHACWSLSTWHNKSVTSLHSGRWVMREKVFFFALSWNLPFSVLPRSSAWNHIRNDEQKWRND